MRSSYGEAKNNSVDPPSANRLPSRAQNRPLRTSTEYSRRLRRGETPARSHGCSPRTRTPAPTWICCTDSARNAFAPTICTVSGIASKRTPTPCTSRRVNASAVTRTTGTPSTNAGKLTTRPSSLPAAAASRRRSNPTSAYPSASWRTRSAPRRSSPMRSRAGAVGPALGKGAAPSFPMRSSVPPRSAACASSFSRSSSDNPMPSAPTTSRSPSAPCRPWSPAPASPRDAHARYGGSCGDHTSPSAACAARTTSTSCAQRLGGFLRTCSMSSFNSVDVS